MSQAVNPQGMCMTTLTELLTYPRFHLLWLKVVVVGTRTGCWPLLPRIPVDKSGISVEPGDMVGKIETCFKYQRCTIYRQVWLTHFLIPCTSPSSWCSVWSQTSHCTSKASKVWQKSGLEENNNKSKIHHHVVPLGLQQEQLITRFPSSLVFGPRRSTRGPRGLISPWPLSHSALFSNGSGNTFCRGSPFGCDPLTDPQ